MAASNTPFSHLKFVDAHWTSEKLQMFPLASDRWILDGVQRRAWVKYRLDIGQESSESTHSSCCDVAPPDLVSLRSESATRDDLREAGRSL